MRTGVMVQAVKDAEALAIAGKKEKDRAIRIALSLENGEIVMKKGFTMIELIFSIVIIGILAAVAIPKLAATRDDALDAKDCANIKTCYRDRLRKWLQRKRCTIR